MKRILLLIIFSSLYFTGFNQKNSNVTYNSGNIFPDENNLSDELKIYPNPCKQEKVTIEFSVKEIEEIRVTNIAGKEILIKKFQFPENKLQIQMTDVPNGIYLMRIKTNDDKFVVRKIIVAKE